MGRDVSIVIGGKAGQGVMRSGEILGKALVSAGLYVFGTNEYLSLIRGGHNMYKLHVDEEPVYSQVKRVDIVLALDDVTVTKYLNVLGKEGIVIYDPASGATPPENVKSLKLEMTEAVRRVGVPEVARNSMGLGAIFALLGLDIKHLEKVISREISRYVEANLELAREGYKKVVDEGLVGAFKLEPRATEPAMYLSGNEATAIGMVRGGVKFYVAYPITPASPILHYLAAKQYDANIIVVQAESELAAVLMAIGAAFVGVRAATATSDGGFDLMTEAIGLAAMAEVPLLIVNVQRHGPSTGLPTMTSQSDLRTVLHASHGEFPRIVVAPGDVEECYYKTIEALNLAEKYQMVAIVLTDKYLGESHMTTPVFRTDVEIERGWILTEEDVKKMLEEGKEYRRFEITETGVSPRILIPTKGAIVKAEGNEHNEYGVFTQEPEKVREMVRKRWRKFEYLKKELFSGKYEVVKVYGKPENADVTFVTWGSTKLPLLEASKILRRHGISACILQVLYLSPFPEKHVADVIKSSNLVIDVEVNYTGLLKSLIKEFTGLEIQHFINRYDGRPIDPEDVVDYVLKVVRR